MNNVTVTGNVGSTPTLHTSESGTKWTSFRFASTRRHQTPDGQWQDGPTIWFTVKAFGDRAQNVCESIAKGTPVIVTGRLAIEEYDVRTTSDNGVDEGRTERHVKHLIENATIGVDLSRGVAKWLRVIRTDSWPANPSTAAVGAPEDPFERTDDAATGFEREFAREAVAA